jgi:hypothetical protein
VPVRARRQERCERGCGCGRVARAFPAAFDAIDFDNEFDGIWASGSVVHIARQDLRSVFGSILEGAQTKWCRLSVFQIWRL